MQDTKSTNNPSITSRVSVLQEDRLNSIDGILNNLASPALSVDTNLQLTYLNSAAKTLLQSPKMPGIEIGCPLDSANVISCKELIDIIQGITNNARPYSGNIQLTMPLHVITLRVDAAPIFDKQNKVKEISVYGQEITGTVTESEQISDARDHWQNVFSNMGFYVWTYYFDSNSVELTSSCYKDLDLRGDIDQRIGLEDVFDTAHPDDKEIILDNYRGFLKNPKGLFLEQEYRMRNRKGQYLWVRDRVSIQFGKDGHPLYAIGLFEDVTGDVEKAQAVETNSRRLGLALDIIGGGLWDFDVKNGVFYIDDRHQRILGLHGQDSFTAQFWLDHIHPDDRKSVYRVIMAVSRENPQFRYQYRIRVATGEYLNIMTLGRGTVFDKEGKPLFSTGVIYDCSADIIAQENLRLSEERLNLAFETAKEGVWEIYPLEKRSFRSQSYFQLLGYPASPDSSAFKFTDDVHPDDHRYLTGVLKGLMNGEKDSDVAQIRMMHHDGHEIQIEIRGRVIARNLEGKATRIVGVTENISERLQHLAEIEALAFYDPLTQLPNRRLVLERANHALELAKRQKSSVTLMILDLDKFKEINDTLGHDAGDLVLQEISKRFLTCMRSMDTLGRQGGDEFIVVLPDCNKRHSYNVASRLIEQVSEPLEIKGRLIRCGVSIGIASAPENGSTIEELLRNADIAMYRAKNSNVNVAWFDPEYARQMERRIKVEQDLRNVVATKALSISYQPRISLDTGEIMSLEALVRWQHPDLGFVSPAEFIPIAEEAGLICDIGQFIIHEVCKQLRTWKDEGINTIASINVSPEELLKDDYTQKLLSTLQKYDLTPESVEVELTETAAIGNWEKVINSLNELHDEGIIISLDDWGTGYSSLSYLTQLPAHFVKLDRSFIEDLHHKDPKKNTQLLLKGMTGLTQSLGFELVAEGIETLEQARSVKELGCLQGQGYLFSRPLPPQDLTDVLKSQFIPINF
jgi:diguanylate cyclase (GGDEF)-like protein/PAS domain S-box-containing protein